MTNNAPADRQSPAWDKYWRARGFFRDDTENLQLSCDLSESYGYCHDRGCVAHGCWIAHDEGIPDPEEHCRVLWDYADVVDVGRSARKAVDAWTAIIETIPPPTNAVARRAWRHMIRVMAELEDAATERGA